MKVKRACLAAALLASCQAGTVIPSATPTPPPTAAPPTPTVAVATPSATAAPTPAATPALPAGCRNEYIGETPIVAPRRSGRFAEVAVDSVKTGRTTFGHTTRWLIRFFDPTGSPGPIGIPLRARVRSASGAELAIAGYEAGPPNAGTDRVTQDIEVNPCDPRAVAGTPDRGVVVLVVHTTAIASGAYTLSVSDLRLPEGGTREESWQLSLTCTAAAGGVTECR